MAMATSIVVELIPDVAVRMCTKNKSQVIQIAVYKHLIQTFVGQLIADLPFICKHTSTKEKGRHKLCFAKSRPAAQGTLHGPRPSSPLHSSHPAVQCRGLKRWKLKRNQSSPSSILEHRSEHAVQNTAAKNSKLDCGM